MKQLITIILLIFPFLSFGQFHEVKEQQEREVASHNVTSIKIYQYDYQNESIDTMLLVLEKYNTDGNLFERRVYSRIDSTKYTGETYYYDSSDYSI